jgi:hypothetical protein
MDERAPSAACCGDLDPLAMIQIGNAAGSLIGRAQFSDIAVEPVQAERFTCVPTLSP